MQASEADARVAVSNALAAAGCSFEELAAQARSGRFESLHARMAWAAVGRYYEPSANTGQFTGSRAR